MVDQIIARDEMEKFMARCLESVGCQADHAKTLAECLTVADYRGHFSHGLNRLSFYIEDIRGGHCKTGGIPQIKKETAATAYVDGLNLLGVVVAKFCMDIAIKKAKDVGIGWVVTKGSNHFGTADTFTLMAAQQGLVGFCCTNTSPLVATVGGKNPFFGTNPLSVAAFGEKHEFVLDMATSVTAYGKIEMKKRKGEKMPDTWAIDATGKPTTNPHDFHALLPLGGLPETGGFKGTGLAMMVELFSAVLSGSTVAPNVRGWNVFHEGPADLGQCFVALDPDCFAPGFKDRMDKLVTDLRKQEPTEGFKEIMVSGDPEVRHERMCDKLGGIPYHKSQIDHAMQLATSLSVEPPKIIGSIGATASM